MVLLVALYVSRYLSKPIIELADAANRLAEGDLAAKVELETTGEVQMLVELHGGNIWAESEGEGKGSAFSFCIPTL